MVDRKTGTDAEVVDILTIDTEDAEYAAVTKVFDTYGIWVLPVMLIEGRTPCWGTTDLAKIEIALKQALAMPSHNQNRA